MKKIIGLMLVILFFIAFYGHSEAAAVCPNLTRTLGRGTAGQEVKDLQGFLAGVPGAYPEALITGYFGSLTEKALQRFQAERGIASSGSPVFNGFGLLGPKTRAMINTVCAEDQAEGIVEVKQAPVPQATLQPTPQPSAAPKPGFYAPTLPYFNRNEVSASGAAPQIDLKINGSDGPITITAGSDLTISWNLSNHGWWYCGKLRDWSGSITSPISGSEVIQNISYNKVFKLNCYVDNMAIEDEVSVQVIVGPVPTPTSSATPTAVSSTLKTGVPYDGPFGHIDCVTSVWPANVIYLNEESPAARWQVQSSPTYDWYFYWHESVDGGPEQHIYAGKTTEKPANNVSKLELYDYKPIKIRRYAEVVIDQKHAPGASYSRLPDSVCKTNEVEFEIKQSRTSLVFSRSFANLFNAIFPYINIAGY